MNDAPSLGRKFDSLTLENRQQRQLAHERCRQYQRAPSKGHLNKLKALFHYCGEQVHIETGFHCDYGEHISIGDGSYLNVNCVLLDGGKITLGQHCLIGPGVQLLTINHALAPEARLEKFNFAKDVNIGNNVWIGAGAIILPGVTIGDNAVIGAGSVVTRNVNSSSLYAGNPARKIKSL